MRDQDSVAVLLRKLIAQDTASAAECEAMAARLGDKHETHNELLRDASQYRQSIHRFGLVIESLQSQQDGAQGGEDAMPYGIIDPDYARIFTIARCLAWSEGYALVMHGSFTRDLDLIAIPWTTAACKPDHLMRRIEDATGLNNITDEPGGKEHGRLAWTLMFPAFNDPRFVDLSIMPRAAALAAPPAEVKP